MKRYIQQTIIVILGLLLAIPTYGISVIIGIYLFNKNGKRQRKEIFQNLINEAYEHYEGKPLITDKVFFESAIKYAEENGRRLSQLKDSITFNTVANGDEVVVVFSKGFNDNLQYNVSNSEKLQKEMMGNTNSFTDNIDKDRQYIEDRQHIINQLNKAELDYEDMKKAYPEIIDNNYLLRIEMKNEENFSLVFPTAEDLKIATELVYFKLSLAVSDYAKEMNEYYKEIGLDNLLIDFKKMSFSEFLKNYDLNDEQIESAYEWQEKNSEKPRTERIVDFKGYSLNFMNYEQGPIAILIANGQNDVEHKTLQEDLDEIPF